MFNHREIRREKIDQLFMGKINLVDDDIEGVMGKLEKVLLKENRIWWDVVTLERYMADRIVPRGLRIKKACSFDAGSIDFMKEWFKILDICSSSLMELIIKERRKELKNLEEEIEELKSMIEPFADLQEVRDIEDEIRFRVQRKELEITERKLKKYRRDTADYSAGVQYIRLEKMEKVAKKKDMKEKFEGLTLDSLDEVEDYLRREEEKIERKILENMEGKIKGRKQENKTEGKEKLEETSWIRVEKKKTKKDGKRKENKGEGKSDLESKENRKSGGNSLEENSNNNKKGHYSTRKKVTDIPKGREDNPSKEEWRKGESQHRNRGDMSRRPQYYDNHVERGDYYGRDNGYYEGKYNEDRYNWRRSQYPEREQGRQEERKYEGRGIYHYNGRDNERGNRRYEQRYDRDYEERGKRIYGERRNDDHYRREKWSTEKENRKGQGILSKDGSFLW